MPRPLLGLLTLLGLLGPLAASSPAQHVVYAESPATPVIVTQPAPTVVTPTRFFNRANRRELRQSNRYTTYRPTYGGRPAVTFAPYSDRYFPNADNTPVAATYYAPQQPTYLVRPR